jgi:cell division protein FtsB
MKRRAARPGSDGVAAVRHQRRPRRRIVESTLVLIGCVVLGDALVGERGLVAMRRARQEYRVEQQKLDAARAEDALLREQIRLLEDDPATIEDLARRELSMIKPGEKLFTVTDRPRDSAR